MSQFIHEDLKPWYSWATTEGPCQAIGTSTVTFNWNGAFGGDYSYEGHVDADGKACDGNGNATISSSYCTGGTCHVNGGFWNDQVHGLAIWTIDSTSSPAWVDVYEVKHSYWYGKSTVNPASPSNNMQEKENDASLSYSFRREGIASEDFYYAFDGTVVKALDPNWGDWVDPR